VSKFNSALVTTLVITSGCGKIGLGGGAAVSEPVPSGTRVAQGVLQGQNGASVSGSAVVYLTDSGYVLRLQSLSISDTNETGFRLRAATSVSASAFTTTLRRSSGDQNYSTGLGGSQLFQEVTIESFSRVPPEIARALLISTL